MTVENDFQDKSNAQKNAGLAGAGGGTLVSIIANQFPQDSIARPTLNYLAPSISILLTALWVGLQVKATNYIRDKEFNKLVEAARRDIEESIKDPNISEEHRAKLRKDLEMFNSMNIERIKSKIKALKVSTTEDFKDKSKPGNVDISNKSNEVMEP
jgi:hypothetical protein